MRDDDTVTGETMKPEHQLGTILIGGVAALIVVMAVLFMPAPATTTTPDVPPPEECRPDCYPPPPSDDEDPPVDDCDESFIEQAVLSNRGQSTACRPPEPPEDEPRYKVCAFNNRPKKCDGHGGTADWKPGNGPK